MSRDSKNDAIKFLTWLDLEEIPNYSGLRRSHKAITKLVELLDKAWEQGFQDHEFGVKLMDIIKKDSK